MKQAKIAYKSGNVVRVNFTDTVNVKYKNTTGITSINIKGIYGADQPVYWGLENIESVVITDIGWQAVTQSAFNVFARMYNVVKEFFNGRG